MLDTIDRPSTEDVTEPAKRWRNMFRVTVSGTVEHEGRILFLRVGEEFWDEPYYPSREVAETKAAERLSIAFTKSGFTYCEYVGAYANGEAP